MWLEQYSEHVQRSTSHADVDAALTASNAALMRDIIEPRLGDLARGSQAARSDVDQRIRGMEVTVNGLTTRLEEAEACVLRCATQQVGALGMQGN